jgi:hypothetical protein
MLLKYLQSVPDHRRGQGRMYDLAHILLFSVLAIASGANSYREVESFIKIHFKTLKKHFKMKWKKAPGYTSIRNIIQGTNKKGLEKAFRGYAKALHGLLSKGGYVFAGLDGKVVRGSFDHFQDQKAIQILSAFLSEPKLILAHETIEEKTNEIPVAQELFEALGLKNVIFTLDALHIQKKH